MAAACNGRRVGARLLAVGIRLGQPGLPHLLDQHTPAREHLHQPGDDGVQQRTQFLVSGRTVSIGIDVDVTETRCVACGAARCEFDARWAAC